MSGPIQFGGLASGLDTASIISALMQVEGIPLQRFEANRSDQQNRLSRIGTLEGLVKDLRTQAQSLAESGSGFEYGLLVGNENLANISITGTPEPGSHTLAVRSLATTSRFNSTGVIDPTEELVTGPGDGEISFEVDGTLYSVDIEDGSGSLDNIAAKINSELGDVASATVINTGTEGSPSYELVLSAKETGSEAAITNLQASGLNSGTFDFNTIEEGSDAVFLIDGLEIRRSSNTFSDVIEGFSFTLQQASEVDGAGDPIATTFGSEIDTDKTVDAIQSFVDAYNDIASFIQKESAFTEEGGASGLLFGDSILGSVRQAAYSGLFSVDIDTVTSDTTGYSTLGIVGFDLGVDGTITLDKDKLAEKLAEDPDAFANLLTGDRDFNGETVSGVLGQLEASLDQILENGEDPSGGSVPDLFEGRRDAINSRIKAFDQNIDREERRLVQFEASLVQRYANLEQLIAGFNSQSGFLGNF